MSQTKTRKRTIHKLRMYLASIPYRPICDQCGQIIYETEPRIDAEYAGIDLSVHEKCITTS